jgi:cytochrome P450
MRNVGELLGRRRGRPTKRPALASPLAVNMLGSDPPDHTRLRRLIGGSFTAQHVQSLRAFTEELAQVLLEQMAQQPSGDLLEAYAYPLSIGVICSLLGIPKEDSAQFQLWSRVLLDQSPGRGVDARAAKADARSYLAHLIDRKRTHPGQDLLSTLVQARDENALTEDELIATAFLLLLAGFETTGNLIGNGMFALLAEPDQLSALCVDATLIPSAVEEFLRYEGPANHTSYRYTTKYTEIKGMVIPPDEFIIVSLTAANRDPERFPEPDRLDTDRETGGHIAFGHGIHHCLGAPLARMEAVTAFTALLHRFPGIRLAVAPAAVTWRPTALVRGLEALPVIWSGDTV